MDYNNTLAGQNKRERKGGRSSSDRTGGIQYEGMYKHKGQNLMKSIGWTQYEGKDRRERKVWKCRIRGTR